MVLISFKAELSSVCFILKAYKVFFCTTSCSTFIFNAYALSPYSLALQARIFLLYSIVWEMFESKERLVPYIVLKKFR